MTQQLLRVNTLADLSDRRPTYLALGSFDGVHIGHQAILRKMVAQARLDGVRSAVLTFFPHPRRLLSGEEGRFYINTLEDRAALLAETGVDWVIIHPFNDTVRSTRAGEFVDQLVTHLDMRQIWGGSFSFGYQREGNLEFLRREGARLGFEPRLVTSLEMFDGRLVSSSRVRHALGIGDFAEVNGCLGRMHSVYGEVVRGDQRGRTIGFPTANLGLWDELLLPADGVYAAYGWLGETRYAAAVNVGVRPTVDGRDRAVEAYLLDFDREIYGESLRLAFDHRIRSEKRFAGLDELKAQIASDVASVRQSLS
ncbi:MAG: riboflavin biosynthesis protein RibF [Candidatus Promineifilaceae bacterium]